MKLRHWGFLAGVALAGVVLLVSVRNDRGSGKTALTMEKSGASGSLQVNSVIRSAGADSQGLDVRGVDDAALIVPRTNQTFRLFESVVPELDFDRGLRKLEKPWYRTAAHERARRYGADGKVTLKIVDAVGNAVPEAAVVSGFHITDDSTLKVQAISDSNGMVELSSRCTGEMFFSVIKSGYYNTRLRYLFSQSGYECVEKGHWLPWNPELEVVLKEKRNPVLLEKRTASLTFPAGLEVGFDFVENDLVSPHGKGIASDCIITVDGVAKENREFHYTTHLAFSEGNGLIVSPSDTFSILQSAYSAPDVGYSRDMVFTYDYDGTHQGSGDSFRRNEILYFKIGGHDPRPASYGKIVGGVVGGLAYPDTNTASIAFTYYLNPNDDDPNLEFEPSNEFTQILER